ncbi:hypothetical protein EGK73_14350 [Enterococcus faecium]|nr:hypothetical protein CR516_07845 [Enterococcus faecium]RSA44696.1 hypothetical protein EGK30_14355 [Enterococcus faecium]RSA95404.1 hypothetical protein EGK49_14350 [Enterococcus faecium]RSB02635.1 hypothetical protein EGK73_14350 [Enterococcus faecium]RSD72617.1 hypothetical protein EGP51_16175 [Enterococcus faecium]
MYATLKIFTYFLKLFKIHPNHTQKKQIFQCRGLVYLGYTLYRQKLMMEEIVCVTFLFKWQYFL